MRTLLAGFAALVVSCSLASGAAAAEAAEAAPAATARAVIRGDQRREPLSKYIYAQFIEHLGRCIYGGIWAEMLEDRKFYYAVDDPGSPWKSFGGEGAVQMVAEDSFVGEHTPLVTAGGGPRGLIQAALGLQRGQQYEGYIWLRPQGEPAAVQVSLVWGGGPEDRQTVQLAPAAGQYVRLPLKFTSGGETNDGQLEIAVTSQSACLVGTASLMPADNVQGMRADTLELLKKLDAPMYRWPGGNFVSGYNWRDGIGDRDRRPPRKNPAWRGVEHNDFGLDEFIAFCRHLDTEPMIVVNTGFGDAYSAAQEVEYANSSADTVGGRWRSENGHPQPYGVRWWGVGNEMYGRWQLGHMQLDHYQIKHNEVVDKMRAVDPAIQCVGVGDVGAWSEGMLKNSADRMDLISEHFYCRGLDDVPAHVAQIPDRIRQKAEAHRRYRETLPQLTGKDIRIAMDEWNYWYGEHVFGELGTRYFLKDGLGIAAGLHEFSRNTDIIAMAHYAQTVNVIGAIKTSKTAAALETTGLVLQLYRQHFGQTPLEVAGDWAAHKLDVAAALTADENWLTIGVVNPHAVEHQIELEVQGLTVGTEAKVFRIAGDDPLLYNDPAAPHRVVIDEQSAQVSGRLSVPPWSVSLYRLPVVKGQ